MARIELKAREHPIHHYRFIREVIKPSGSKTTDVIQTSQGEVGRLIGVNGHLPSAEERADNYHLLARIINDHKLQQSRLKDQQSENSRENKLLSALPDAFLYQYDGTEKDNQVIRLKFKPDPDFQPSSREANVLTGMEGTLWVEASSHRLVKIEGVLVKDVSFGWGILAKLYRGGHFIMAQAKVPNGTWQRTLLNVTFKGRVLIFKSLNVKMKQEERCYEPVPNNLTIAQAVTMLVRTPMEQGNPNQAPCSVLYHQSH